MSTLGDVLSDTAGLVAAFDELLSTKTIAELATLARDLGAEAQLAQATDSAAGIVRQVGSWVGQAHLVATMADAAVALFGILPLALRGAEASLQRLSAGAGERRDEVRDLIGIDLGAIERSTADARSALGSIAGGLQVGVDVVEGVLDFVGPAQFGTLRVRLDELAIGIEALGRPAPQRPAP